MSRRRQSFRTFLKGVALLVFSAGFLVLGALFLFVSTLSVPDLHAIEERRVPESTKIYDRTGKVLLYDLHRSVQRKRVSFEDISRHLKNATVAIEDAEFYEHKGIKSSAIFRAILVNLGSGSIRQGGSTITQQVVKNLLLTQERSFTRKIKEIFLATKLDQTLSKEEILNLYLNEAPYGGNIYGAEEVSLSFFGKKASDISLAEAAYLAALPKAPTYYSPYGPHAKELDARKNLVLKRMAELKFVSDDESAQAQGEKVVFLPLDERTIKAPHFVMMVRSYLEEKFGEGVPEERGLKVITTLDFNIQKKAEGKVSEFADNMAKNFNASNTAVVAINPKTGEVLALVGSRNYFDTEHDGNFNVAIARRQPGSALKPFIYAAAFKKGLTPETILFDLKTQFETRCDSEGKPLSPAIREEDCYIPQNYTLTFHGPMNMRNALAQSVNIPAIKTLHIVGLTNALKLLRSFGITTLNEPERYGLTLVLGGGEVSLLELTSAYGVLANDGVRNPHKIILRIEDEQGNALEEMAQEPTRVIEEQYARQVTDILADNEARKPSFGDNSPLLIAGRDVAVKTGTTNNYRDGWVLGYTPSFVLGAWTGNNDNSSMEKKVAGFIIAPLWNALMKEILADMPEETFKKTEGTPKNISPVLRGIWQGGETYTIDKISKKLATEYTPEETKEEKVITDVHDILYWLGRKDDPQFLLWEDPVRKWVLEQKIKEESSDVIPKESDDVHGPLIAPRISITSPSQSKTYKRTDRITVTFERLPGGPKQFPISEAILYADGNYLGSRKSAPYSFVFSPVDTGIKEDGVELRIIVYDSARNKTEVKTIARLEELP